ncbi:MAG: potassium channel family protein [Anaerolineales bacterium]
MKSSRSFRPQWMTAFKQDLRVFVRLFPWRIFALLLVGTGIMARVFQLTYNDPGPHNASLTYVQALLSIIKIVQLDYDFPAPSQIDLFLVLVPLVGLPFLLFFGVNIINVLRVFFVRADRGQAWQVALTSTFDDHVLICGVGRVGYRLASQLLELEVPVVGINDVPSALVDALIDEGMPLILGDSRSPEVLKQGGVERAATVVVATNDDLVNIETAFHVGELNPDARVILRFFDDELAGAVQQSLGVDAVISRSAVAAVAFAHAAVGMEILEAFDIGGQTYIMARAHIDKHSPLVDRVIADVAEEHDVTVVFHCRPGGLTIEPEPATRLAEDDELFIFAAAEHLEPLIRRGLFAHVSLAPEQPPILVCSLGHTGYRIVKTLLNLGQRVIALDMEPSTLAERLVEEGVPVIIGDFRQRSSLMKAGIQEALGLVACSVDDMVNLETALRARDLNPDLRIILRLFEEELGERLRTTFGLSAVYSTSALANPAFLSETLQVNVAQPVEVDDVRFFLTRFAVRPLSSLVGVSIAELDAEPGLTTVLHTRAQAIDIPPTPQTHLRIGDEIVVLASQSKLRDLARRNRSLREVVQK